MKAERDEAVARMAQLTPRLEATNRELMVATAAAKAAASEVEALEGELDEVQSTIEGLRSGGKAYATEAAVVARLEQQLQDQRAHLAEHEESMGSLKAALERAQLLKEKEAVARMSTEAELQAMRVQLATLEGRLEDERAIAVEAVLDGMCTMICFAAMWLSIMSGKGPMPSM